MKALVTGGAGFVGVNLVQRLIKEGYTVHVIDNLTTGDRGNIVYGSQFTERDAKLLESSDDKYDVVFHLAAQSRIQPSFDDPVYCFDNNVKLTQIVCEFCRRTKTKLVYAGSSSKWHDPYQSPYAMYKYLGEEVCKMYKKTFNVDVEIARFYNVYGPSEILDGKDAAVVGIFRRLSQQREALTIVGDGEQRRDFTHVEDIVDGLFRISTLKQVHEDAWELGTGINYSINELANMFVDKFGVTTVYIPDQPGNYRETLQLNDDAQRRLGWEPKDRLNEYIMGLRG